MTELIEIVTVISSCCVVVGFGFIAYHYYKHIDKFYGFTWMLLCLIMGIITYALAKTYGIIG